MLNIPGIEVEVPAKKSDSAGYRYISQPEVEKELGWTKQDADELFVFAEAMPRVREQSTYGRQKMWTCQSVSHAKAKGNGRGFTSNEPDPKCPKCGSSEVKPAMKHIIGLGSYSISANKRGLRDGVVNPKSKDIDSAPPVVRKVADKLTRLNGGKPINYLSLIAYENEGDHINWHQHNEDRCRDATVYIVSMGETRKFGIRRVCEQHRICDKCNGSCHADSKTLCRKCKANVKARKDCKTCESTPKQWTSLQPEHGSIIVLPHDYNVTHEHAILGKQDVGGDKTEKGLRISINTKNIREEDIAYVERENRNGEPIPLSADKIHKGVAPGTNKPRVYSIKRKHPQDAIYVGCAGGWKGCKCHADDINSGSMYGNSYKPREFGGHFKHPIAKTPEEYRTKLDKKWESKASKDIAWKERAIKELRGRNLLCWCLQPEDVDPAKGTKPEGCHARVLFEYVNRNEGKGG